MSLLRDTFDEEILHLNLRTIRDEQAPRFEALREAHPEIVGDFKDARGIHDSLLTIRRDRIKKLTELIEGA